MLPDSLTWGALPEGFAKLSDGNGNRMIVRRERQPEIGIATCVDAQNNGAASNYRGRGALTAVCLADGETALVRTYRHGGILRGLTGHWFFTWPPRPLRELVITEELRRRGLPTAEVYAACISRSVGPFYRGWFVTRELRGALDLWSALEQRLVERFGEDEVLRAVATSI